MYLGQCDFEVLREMLQHRSWRPVVRMYPSAELLGLNILTIPMSHTSLVVDQVRYVIV